MANLESDIVGQVARLPLKPSEASALLPLYEALSNSLHAIQDRFGDGEHAERGQVDIEILRHEITDGHTPIIGFVIKDNGIGLNGQNYKSFCTPFSQHKLGKGGKGVGRLGWLKVFKHINVKSHYMDGSVLASRDFDFVLRDREQIVLKNEVCIENSEPGTTVQLMDFIDSYSGRCPIKTDTIVQRIIAHFVPVFAGNKSPKILLHDNGENIDLRQFFNNKIVNSEEELLEIEIDRELQPAA